MNRRQLLKLLVSGVVGHTLDVDRLLWVPGSKTIFIPTQRQIDFLSASDIVVIELERIRPRLKTLFERDSVFYKILSERQCQNQIENLLPPKAVGEKEN